MQSRAPPQTRAMRLPDECSPPSLAANVLIASVVNSSGGFWPNVGMTVRYRKGTLALRYHNVGYRFEGFL